MTHSEYLVVFITVQNLVLLISVILIIQTFQYFARLDLDLPSLVYALSGYQQNYEKQIQLNISTMFYF